MPNTPALALPYPAPAAVPDVPYWLQQLAEAVDTLVAARTKDTGNISSAAGVLTVTSDWTLGPMTVRKVGLVVDLYLTLTYKGVTIASSSSGNIANIGVGTLAAPYRPHTGSIGALTTCSTGYLSAVYCPADTGLMALSAIAPGQSLTSGDSLNLQGSWLANSY